MIDIAWAIVRNGDRYLLAQRSVNNAASGTWCFPNSELTSVESPSGAAQRKLRQETGLMASGLKEAFETQVDDYNVHVVECPRWSGRPYPADDSIIGIGWFTIPEMWNLDRSLSPFLAKILPQFTFLMRHSHKYKDTRRTSVHNG